mgnify:CR=1 FL=1
MKYRLTLRVVLDNKDNMCAFFGRGLNRHQNPFTLVDMYKEYMLEYKDKDLGEIEYHIFISLIEEYYKQLMEEILLNGVLFKMPFRMGYFRIIKRKLSYSHKIAIDWDTTNKIGKKVYHLNDHTHGYKYIFKWNKRNLIFKYCNLYRLVITRTHKRRLASLIKAGQDYYEER